MSFEEPLEHMSRKRGLSDAEQPLRRRNYAGTSGHQYVNTYISGEASVHQGDSHTHYHLDDPQERAKERILDSLSFEQMHTRYEQVCEAKEGTYDWILDESKVPVYDDSKFDASKSEQWNSYIRGRETATFQRLRERMRRFQNWLVEGTGIFWVTGKPGSGKSALIKHLVSQFNTSPEAESSPSVVLHHFFWLSGQPLQRNVSGCLRNILMQLIQQRRTAPIAMRYTGNGNYTAWTESRLRSIILAVLKDINFPIFVFIDGLDECDDGNECLKLLRILAIEQNVKLCVSSRPEPEFVSQFETAASIRMQDVNSHAIKTVIQTDFMQSSQISRLIASSSGKTIGKDIEYLKTTLEGKAEGVFLWVHYVIKTVLKGISNQDTLGLLIQRVEKLPKNVQDLFRDMLQRQGDDFMLYQRETSLYLTMALHATFTLQHFCFIADDGVRARSLDVGEYRHLDIKELDPVKIAGWVQSRTAGLLEIVSNINDVDQLSLTVDSMEQFKVLFIHRTVRDFLLDSLEGRHVIACSAPTESSVRKLCLESRVASAVVRRPSNSEKAWHLTDIFACPACPDEARLDQIPIIEPVCQLYWDRRMIEDSDPCFYGHLDNNDLFVLDGPHDLMLTLLFECSKFEVARHYLNHLGYWQDVNKLSSTIGTLALQSLSDYDITRGNVPVARALLKDFIDAGARIDQELQMVNGETYSPMTQIAHQLWPHALFGSLYQWQRFQNAWSSYAELNLNWLVASQARCLAYHQIWSPNPRPQLWGSFCAVELATTPHFHFDRVYNPAESDRLKAHRDKCYDAQRLLTPFSELRENIVQIVAETPYGRAPILRAVNPLDSAEIIDLSRERFVSEHSIPGVLSLTTSRFSENDRQRYKVILERSPILDSFAAAMVHIGKPLSAVYDTYDKIALRTHGVHPEDRASWEEWFWSHGKNAASFDPSENRIVFDS